METPNPVKLGGFLFVSNVQEFAKQSPGEVPAPYIRNDQDPMINNISGTCMLDQTVPIIDLQKLLSPVPIIGESELDQLHSACKEWGFFQVVNHGIDILLVEKLKSETQDFFNLPMDEKNIFWQADGDIEGFGQAFVHSEEQKLDWGDMFFMLTLPKCMRKPRLFRKLPLPFRETIESYSSELSKLRLTVIQLMAKALRIENRVMTELFEDGIQTMRMNYYPP
ncbi:hypothetical protein C5167_021007 [Papaver somniferum]|uniref:Non-haem dioxygenase N-terminal domain-containing protein n=1 Tax=Papaver somniferum TaxID=3469 RepID=A0A4Y7IYK2_PAPSO|nr:hypothetical protein C5167_021007 [Papaver somniferum]